MSVAYGSTGGSTDPIVRSSSRHAAREVGRVDPAGGIPAASPLCWGLARLPLFSSTRSDYAFCACFGVEHTRRWSVTSRTGAEARKETPEAREVEVGLILGPVARRGSRKEVHPGHSAHRHSGTSRVLHCRPIGHTGPSPRPPLLSRMGKLSEAARVSRGEYPVGGVSLSLSSKHQRASHRATRIPAPCESGSGVEVL